MDIRFEAMFANLAHFSYAAIQTVFTFLVYPALILAYMGQATYLSQHHHTSYHINKDRRCQNAEEACETDELRPLKKAKLVVDEKCFDEGEGPNWKVKKLVDKEEDEIGLDGSHAANETNCKKVVQLTILSVLKHFEQQLMLRRHVKLMS
ncbi:hypothetical protein GOBAR_AA26775 [Gossypium barbadense]|uniref:K+ potassium transporter integral membrane domain-containing protein n=1 Tax=Gossypium barbadense TaxID=3634 RepID=A0A2P5WS42_GOSBA|nr:hypothetical protein GOBAR_AA26775 [Gossypium barbadense]